MVDTDSFDQILAGTLGRRLYAAAIDMVLASIMCFGILQSDGVLMPVVLRQLGGPALAILAGLIIVEAATGRSIGKSVMGLRVTGISDDHRASVLRSAVRALARWVAPLIAVASLVTKDIALAGLLVGGAMTMVICEIPACYITMFRTGGTIFDLIARTRVRFA